MALCVLPAWTNLSVPLILLQNRSSFIEKNTNLGMPCLYALSMHGYIGLLDIWYLVYLTDTFTYSTPFTANKTGQGGLTEQFRRVTILKVQVGAVML